MPTSVTHTDQITVSLRPDHTVRGINVYAVTMFYDDASVATGAAPVSPRDATLEDVADLLAPSLVAQQEQITSLTAQLADASMARDTALADAAAKQTIIEGLQAQVARLTAPTPESSVLTQLDAALNAVLTPEQRAGFAPEILMVRYAVQQGMPDEARAVIANTPVPPELESARAQILALLA